jgi:hypothetical protein
MYRNERPSVGIGTGGDVGAVASRPAILMCSAGKWENVTLTTHDIF